MSAAERPAHDARILVIQVARIGDTLLVTPALRAIKSALPKSALTVLAHPSRCALLEGLPYIDALGAITPKTAWWRGRLGGIKWDYALVYGQDSALIRYASRVARRVVAFAQRDAAIDALLWKAVEPPREPLHAVAERLMLPAALGIETEDGRLDYRVAPSEHAAACEWLERHLPHDSRPLVGIQLASFPTKAYRDWPRASFAELARRLLAHYPRAHILLLGGQESRAASAALAEQIDRRRVVPVAGKLPLRETAALMSRLDLYVGVDTGPTHLAGALRIPMVAMYHCRHRGRYLAPLQHERLHVIEHPATDADCTATTSMSAITVEHVWEAVRSLLDRRQGAGLSV